HSNGMFAQGDVGEDTMSGRRIRSAESVSSRGPPKDGLDDTKHNLAANSPSRRAVRHCQQSNLTIAVSSSLRRLTPPAGSPYKRIVDAGNLFDLSQRIAPGRDAAATCDSATPGDFGARGRNLI